MGGVIVPIVAMIAATLFGATPAQAATGSGVSDGTYTINSTGTNFPPPCSVVYEYTYASDPLYTGAYTSGGHTYAGPLTVTMTAAQTIEHDGEDAVGYENPEGLYNNETCTDPDVDGWPVSADVDGGTDDNGVECEYTGRYNRRASQATTWDVQGECTVWDDTGSDTSDTREVHEGVLGECTEDDNDPPPESCKETNTWEAVEDVL